MLPPLPKLERPWIASRAEAERRLAAFLPRAGRDYAAQRNFDRGPAERANVSVLSPYVRHRVLTEAELLAAVLERHSPSGAEKFISEIFWRTYWKGWLETHPAAWTRYRAALDERLTELAASPARRRTYADAMAGSTGFDAFDSWSRELVGTNYLHNHARMWFASIWIFTLGLPWELGADFFMRHLLDGDPASNTLSWRWVAGLQTRGKSYRATRDNIGRYTGGRFALARPLAAVAPALDEPSIPIRALPALPTAVGAEATLFVLHDDDLHGDLADLPPGVRGVCALRATACRSPLAVSAAVAAFEDALAGESVRRIADAGSAVDLGLISADEGSEPGGAGGAQAAGRALCAAAAACGATRIVVAFAPVGPVREAIDSLRPIAVAGGATCVEIARRYDAVSWPAATRGFFNLRSRIPAILAELGIGSG
jgi:hypothetical protein